MSQPVFKCIANLGDVGWLDHGGVFVYEDLTGVYPPELEVVEEQWPGDEETVNSWTVYRVCCDKCYFTDGVLSDNKYHKDHPVWWERVLAGDEDEDNVDRLVRLVCSDDPLERAMGYLDVAQDFGWYEFDHDPLRFDDRRQLERRYALGNREPYLYAGTGVKPKLRPRPAVLAWNDGCVAKLAAAAARNLLRHDAATLPILADALEDAGCTMTPVLDHLRAGARHFEDCWAVKWCLNKSFPRKDREGCST